MTSASQNPVPKRNVIMDKKGTDGALGGIFVGVPSADVYSSSSDKVRSVDSRRDPKATADMAQPTNMYDFRRYPNIGKLSDINPNINFSDAGSDFKVDMVTCCASVAPKSKGYTLIRGPDNP
mmetsp:Transcript_6833/g.16773  ORF Transcript_6833/g.16773 Transcript_6833/m.16773 type:complete len:122 (-) Transcript_6833:476-841(-)